MFCVLSFAPTLALSPESISLVLKLLVLHIYFNVQISFQCPETNVVIGGEK
jgi:hypothetical protein